VETSFNGFLVGLMETIADSMATTVVRSPTPLLLSVALPIVVVSKSSIHTLSVTRNYSTDHLSSVAQEMMGWASLQVSQSTVETLRFVKQQSMLVLSVVPKAAAASFP